ncbi:MAG: helix-turn-helix domain-containing protein [Oscillospiraceae bacterium]|jgi:transcriptional regulator with XRE-family HTH domain|nr:helix-turn-helix domain-containing protein [Oscillospiraceae bacterium]
MSNHEILSERIRHYRKLKGLTQRAMAEKLGVAPKYISQIEQGLRGPGLDTHVEICKVLGVTMADLLPVNLQDDSEAKEQIIAEINAALRSLKYNQLGLIRDMLCSMDGR